MRIFTCQRFSLFDSDLLRKTKARSVSKLLAISVGLFLLAASGCSSLSSGSSTGATSTAGGGAGSISPSDKPLDVMINAVRAQMAAKSYRAKVESISAVSTNNSTFEFAAPDRYHMTVQADIAGRPMNSEYIIIGKDTWMNRNGQGWTKSPVDFSSAVAAVHDQKMLDEMQKGVDAKLIGPETVDGIPTLVYQYTINKVMDDNSQINLTAKAWVSVANGLIHKLEMDNPDTKTKTIATYTDYNSAITIEPPIK